MIGGQPFIKEKHTIHVYWKGVKRYTDENGEDTPDKAGVYEILTKRKDEDRYDRKYIGQAVDLRARYFDHLSNEEENENIHEGVRKWVCGFDHALLDLEADRKDAEQAIYDKHKHPWNKERPEGSGRSSDIEVVEHNPG